MRQKKFDMDRSNKINKTLQPSQMPVDKQYSVKYVIHNSSFACNSTNEEGAGEYVTKGKVYWTVFAGRRDRLSLQVSLSSKTKVAGRIRKENEH